MGRPWTPQVDAETSLEPTTLVMRMAVILGERPVAAMQVLMPMAAMTAVVAVVAVWIAVERPIPLMCHPFRL